MKKHLFFRSYSPTLSSTTPLAATQKVEPKKNLLTLCKSNIGLFAHGPKQILNHYFACLTKAGKEPYFFGDNPAKKWDGVKWVLEDKDLKLALLGGTYFIGQSFKFIQLNK